MVGGGGGCWRGGRGIEKLEERRRTKCYFLRFVNDINGPFLVVQRF